MRASVELYEHEPLCVGDALRVRSGPPRTFTEAEHAALARFNDMHGGKFFRLGHKSITATQFVGYVEVRDLAIEILPKADKDPVRGAQGSAWHQGLVEMLRAATDLRLESPSPASQLARRATLLELVARRFVAEVERLLHEGLAKGYRDEEANGPAFRGKLLFPQQIRENIVRADRFYVRYSTFDRDIVVNRILREALEGLQGLALSGGLAARAAACAATFPDVRGLRITAETFERVVLGRSTARYRDALLLARMLSEQRAPELRSGGAPVFALLFDMNQLWEGYIGALLRRAAGRRLDVSTQEQTALWKEPGAPSRAVRPDFVVRTADRTTVLLVADTKWRATPDGVPSDNELKQMFVYAELLNAPRAILLYPRTGPATERSGRFALSGRVCETKQLGVVDQHAWLGGAMQQQLETLLETLKTKPNEAA